jgi:hypothetical protein
MGGKSTSQGALLDDKAKSPVSSFDLHSWQGLTEVLRVGKETLKNPTVYAEFRNLVLEYAQKGGDIELRKKIDVLLSHAVKNTVQSVQTPQTTPQEDAVSVVSEPVVESSSHTHSIFIPRSISVDSVHTTSTATKQSVAPQRRTTPQFGVKRLVVTDVTPIAHEQEEVSLPSQPSHIVVQETEVVPEPTPQPIVVKSIEEHKARIAAIKRAVHAHIGNPAALIDTHNDIGKRYMSALLAALKATGAGNGENVEGTMMQLEEAYDVLVHDVPQAVPVLEVPEPQIIPPAVVPQTPIVPVQEKRAPIVKNIPVVQVDSPVVDVPQTPVLQPTIEPEVIVVPPQPAEPSVPHVAQEKPIQQFVAPTPAVIQHEQQAVVAQKTVVAATPVYTEETTVDSVPKKVETVAPATPPVQREQTQTTVQQSELATPEITKALHELLHEWSIFEGSGFLGIGPGGAEHPLYIKLAPLSMGEVVSGRWEGPDHTVRKVIKEYVDAWRHEQGIAYNVNETFEHYLRRVVQRILKRQQK